MHKSKKKENNFEDQLYAIFIPITKYLQFKELDKKLQQADIPLDSDVYLSKYFFFAVLSFILIVFIGGALLVLTSSLQSLSFLLIIGLLSFFGVVAYAFVNPYIVVSSKVNNIKNNLSLAILGMSSIAESGAPPEAIFTTSSVRQDTPYINKELLKITYYIENLGLSLLEAIDLVAKKTPSFELKKFLFELKSNIESGGALPEFMKKKAEHAQFEYHLMLDKLNKKAETFGDIYSAVVIAGPLFLFSGIMLLGMVGGGGIAGLSISSLLAIGVFGLVPLINILFFIILNIVS